jgi:hypothetical protein
MTYEDNMHSVDPYILGCEKGQCTNKAKLPVGCVLKCIKIKKILPEENSR